MNSFESLKAQAERPGASIQVRDCVSAWEEDREQLLKRMDEQRVQLAEALTRIADLTPRWVRVEDGFPKEGKYCRIVGRAKYYDKILSTYGMVVDGKWSVLALEINTVIAWLQTPDEPKFDEVEK